MPRSAPWDLRVLKKLLVPKTQVEGALSIFGDLLKLIFHPFYHRVQFITIFQMNITVWEHIFFKHRNWPKTQNSKSWREALKFLFFLMFERWGREFLEFASTGEFLITEVANQRFKEGVSQRGLKYPYRRDEHSVHWFWVGYYHDFPSINFEIFQQHLSSLPLEKKQTVDSI